MLQLYPIALAIFLLFLAACVTAPITGRSQFVIVSEEEEVSLGEEAYRQILRESVISRNPDALRIVREVGRKIARPTRCWPSWRPARRCPASAIR